MYSYVLVVDPNKDDEMLDIACAHGCEILVDSTLAPSLASFHVHSLSVLEHIPALHILFTVANVWQTAQSGPLKSRT